MNSTYILALIMISVVGALGLFFAIKGRREAEK
jgi:hypothetical protein